VDGTAERRLRAPSSTPAPIGVSTQFPHRESRLDLRTLYASFRLAFLGENKSERTVEAYTDAVRFFADFSADPHNP
jgi:hypothetical protein